MIKCDPMQILFVLLFIFVIILLFSNDTCNEPFNTSLENDSEQKLLRCTKGEEVTIEENQKIINQDIKTIVDWLDIIMPKYMPGGGDTLCSDQHIKIVSDTEEEASTGIFDNSKLSNTLLEYLLDYYDNKIIDNENRSENTTKIQSLLKHIKNNDLKTKYNKYE